MAGAVVTRVIVVGDKNAARQIRLIGLRASDVRPAWHKIADLLRKGHSTTFQDRRK